MSLRSVLPFACALVLLGATPPPSFTYDPYAPLDLSVETTTHDAAVRIDRIAYRAQDQIVEATLVSPDKSPDSMPGVLFVRDTGDAQTGDDATFLEDAKWLARRGAVSLIPDVAWADPHAPAAARPHDDDVRETIGNVIALRRGFDALAGTLGVDKARLAYVGHGLGATYGALLCGVDLRADLAVFAAPRLEIAGFDTRGALARSSFTASLLQFAKHDRVVSKADADAFANAVPGSDRTIDVYDTDHELATDAPADDRRAWLATHLFKR